jgi:hypothetical protein
MSSNQSKHLFCMYADDVRTEVGGKLTIVGLYQGGQIALHGSLPMHLPRLAIIANLFCPSPEVVKSIKIGVKLNDDLLLPELDVPSEVIAMIQERGTKDPESVGAGLQIVQIIQPLEVKAAGEIRCYAMVDGEQVKGNILEVMVVPSPTPMP